MSNDTIASLLTLVLVAPGGGLMAVTAWRALKSGEFFYRDGPARRDRNPATFWFSVMLYAACALMLGAIGVYAVFRLT